MSTAESGPVVQVFNLSTDHKIIGIQYGITALLFLFFGFMLMLMMRWSMAYPNEPLPLVGTFLQNVLGSDMVGDKILETGVKIPGVIDRKSVV